MNMKTKVASLVLLALSIAAVAIGAVKGDAPGWGLNGRLKVQAFDGSVTVFDGGVGSAVRIPFKPGQNAIALYNAGILDGGTSQIVYCGWQITTATPTVGFPIPALATLSIDVSTAAISGTTGTPPALYCQAASGILSEMDVRFMVVK